MVFFLTVTSFFIYEKQKSLGQCFLPSHGSNRFFNGKKPENLDKPRLFFLGLSSSEFFFQGSVTMKQTFLASTHRCLPIFLKKNFGLPGILKVPLHYSSTLLRKQK
jgi:hypothetical protein